MIDWKWYSFFRNQSKTLKQSFSTSIIIMYTAYCGWKLCAVVVMLRLLLLLLKYTNHLFFLFFLFFFHRLFFDDIMCGMKMKWKSIPKTHSNCLSLCVGGCQYIKIREREKNEKPKKRAKENNANEFKFSVKGTIFLFLKFPEKKNAMGPFRFFWLGKNVTIFFSLFHWLEFSILMPRTIVVMTFFTNVVLPRYQFRNKQNLKKMRDEHDVLRDLYLIRKM